MSRSHSSSQPLSHSPEEKEKPKANKLFVTNLDGTVSLRIL
jgi:hypothetical protein